MSKGRYITGLAVGGALFIIGTVLSCVFAGHEYLEEMIGFIILSYIVACTVICLIWTDPVVSKISLVIISICACIFEFMGGCFSGDVGECGTCLSIIAIAFIGVVFTAGCILFLVAVLIFPCCATLLFPFRIFSNAKDLY